MPKYAVLLKYEVVSGLFVEAENEDEAARIATEFETTTHELEHIDDSGDVRIVTRLWGDGTLEPEEVEDYEEAEETIEAWIEEDESEDEDLDGEDDEFDEDDDESDDDESDDDEDESDDDEDDEAEVDDEDDDAADELDVDHDPSHDAEHDDDDFGGELEPPARA